MGFLLKRKTFRAQIFGHPVQPVNSHEVLGVKAMQKLILGAGFVNNLLPLMATLKQFTDGAGLPMCKVLKPSLTNQVNLRIRKTEDY